MSEQTDDFLAHYGVKGMRWGKRRSDKELANARVTRKQNRQMNKEASEKFYSDKASNIYQEAKKAGDQILISTRMPGDSVQTITTGKEFAAKLERGGMLDVKSTEIFARQPKPDSQYVLNDNIIGTYKKQDFRKS